MYRKRGGACRHALGCVKLSAEDWKVQALKVIAIAPEEYSARLHRLPVAGELLLPGVQACVGADGVAYALKQALMPRGACGTVVELCRRGEGVEVAIRAEQQADGGFFFEAIWVLAG